jgi:hypothetical protein
MCHKGNHTMKYTDRVTSLLIVSKTVTKTKLRGFGPRANDTDRPSDRRLLAKLVPTFADRGCLVVSAKDSHGR